jgi:hypothetical protein
MFYFATPLIGISFYYLSENYDKEYYDIDTYLIFIYISFMEINHGLFLFSFIIFFLIFHRFFLAYIAEAIVCHWCLPIIYVTIGYIGYFLFNLFIANIFNTQSPDISVAYLVYIITDIILVFGLL